MTERGRWIQDSSGTYNFLYSDIFAQIPGFDITSVDGVELEVRSDTPNASFVISNFNRNIAIVASPVPEPATGLVSALLLSVGILRRRRRSQ